MWSYREVAGGPAGPGQDGHAGLSLRRQAAREELQLYPTLTHNKWSWSPTHSPEVTPHGIIDDTGVEHNVDFLVMCTGFTPATFLATMDVVGRDGVSLHHLSGGATAGATWA